jgi:capsular polysaccharide biosynthesis protein
METETEPRRARPRPLVEPRGEEEIDVGRHARVVVARWWLVLAAVALGALVGWAFSSAGGSDVNRAEATVFLGQPTAALGGTSVQTVATNQAAVREIARAGDVVAEVAGRVGIDPDELRRGISTSVVTGTTQNRQLLSAPLFEVSVRGEWPRRAVAQAANLLAAAVVERTSGYVDTKIEAYEERLDSQDRALGEIERRINELETAVSDAQDLSSVERLTLVTLIGIAEDRRAQLTDERSETRLLLVQAQDVERGQVVTEASALQVSPRTSRTSAVVGGLIGLLIGIVLALAWEPLRRGRLLRA